MKVAGTRVPAATSSQKHQMHKGKPSISDMAQLNQASTHLPSTLKARPPSGVSAACTVWAWPLPSCSVTATSHTCRQTEGGYGSRVGSTSTACLAYLTIAATGDGTQKIPLSRIIFRTLGAAPPTRHHPLAQASLPPSHLACVAVGQVSQTGYSKGAQGRSKRKAEGVQQRRLAAAVGACVRAWEEQPPWARTAGHMAPAGKGRRRSRLSSSAGGRPPSAAPRHLRLSTQRCRQAHPRWRSNQAQRGHPPRRGRCF